MVLKMRLKLVVHLANNKHFLVVFVYLAEELLILRSAT